MILLFLTELASGEPPASRKAGSRTVVGASTTPSLIHPRPARPSPHGALRFPDSASSADSAASLTAPRSRPAAHAPVAASIPHHDRPAHPATRRVAHVVHLAHGVSRVVKPAIPQRRHLNPLGCPRTCPELVEGPLAFEDRGRWVNKSRQAGGSHPPPVPKGNHTGFVLSANHAYVPYPGTNPQQIAILRRPLPSKGNLAGSPATSGPAPARDADSANPTTHPYPPSHPVSAHPA